MLKVILMFKVRMILMARCGSHPMRRTDHVISAGKGAVLTHYVPAWTSL